MTGWKGVGSQPDSAAGVQSTASVSDGTLTRQTHGGPAAAWRRIARCKLLRRGDSKPSADPRGG
ncbi:hypothetical protein ACI48J_15795 [Paenibacillus chitinolyticus]|uniref:hypothetical protein n=1 Tax=Paenibacillus chitinolyticus TaxID=79263 RepID=UPI00386F0127